MHLANLAEALGHGSCEHNCGCAISTTPTIQMCKLKSEVEPRSEPHACRHAYGRGKHVVLTEGSVLAKPGAGCRKARSPSQLLPVQSC
jgi:hypothetical protein